MGKKGSWFSAVKKVLSLEPKDKKIPKSKGWFGRQENPELGSTATETALVHSMETETALANSLDTSTVEEMEEMKLSEAENEQNKHVYSAALATAAAAEAAVAAAKAAAEVVQLTTAAAYYSGKSKEETAAIKIQTAFRGFMARRALRAMKGLVRLKNMIQEQSVKRQATATLKCMQTLAHMQSQIHVMRIRMSEENEALKRQLQQKHERELEKKRASIEDKWNGSIQSREQVEAKRQNKQEAALRRERALAYSYSHQKTWRDSSKSRNTFMDPNNPQWGWSWLDRWMAARPWESRTAIDKELKSDRACIKSTTSQVISATEFRRTPFYHDNHSRPLAHKQGNIHGCQLPSTPHSKAPNVSVAAGKIRSPSTRGSDHGFKDDSRSMYSAHSEYQRRHSIAGSSVRDEESLARTPSYHDNHRHPSAHKQSNIHGCKSPSTPHAKAPTFSVASGKIRSPSIKGSNRGFEDDSSRSMYSAQSECQRRHSIVGSSVRDDESLASSLAVPSYMASTWSAKAKSPLPSPLRSEKIGTPERRSVSLTKKRLSFSPPGAIRRHSDPPKIDCSSIKDITATS